MGRKRPRADGGRRQRLSRRLALLAVAALAWTSASAPAVDAIVPFGAMRIRGLGRSVQFVGPRGLPRPRQLEAMADDEAGVVHGDDGTAAAAAEDREGSGSSEPTEAPAATTAAPVATTAAPAATTAVPVPSPTGSSPSSSRDGDVTPAPSSSETPAPTPVPSTAEPSPTPTPTLTPTPTPTPAPSPSPEATTQTPAPTTEAPTPAPPATTTAAPTTTPPAETTTAPPATTTTAPPAPSTAAPPAATTAAPPPAETTAAPPAATTAAPPATTTAAPPPATTTAAPPATTAKPTATTPTVTPTPTPTTKTPASTTAAPAVTTMAPSPLVSSGASSGSSASDSKSDGNSKVAAPDLSTLSPISGVISKSTKQPASSSDGSSALSKSKSADSGLSKISTLGIAGIIMGLLAVVVVAILFVSVRRKRNADKENDPARQRELDNFFLHPRAPPIPHNSHPGAASFISSNGMTFVAPPPSLTPPSEIPLATSSRFKRPGVKKAMTPGAATADRTTGGRFSDSVMSEGVAAGKARMYSIPASPRGHSSDYDASNDSFLGGSRQASTNSGYSIRTSSDEMSAGPRSTGTSTYFPTGHTESRSTMVEMGMASSPRALPRGDGGNILLPRPAQDVESSVYSISDDEYGSPENRFDRGDSNVSSASNPNPWAMVTLDDSLLRSASPARSADNVFTHDRDGSQASSMMTDLPSTRSDALSDGSFYLSDDGRSTQATDFDVDNYDDNGNHRRDSYPSYGTGSQGSQLSFMSSDSERRSSGFRPSNSGPDVLEGHI